MDDKVVSHIQKLRSTMRELKEHPGILADLFLEEKVKAYVQQISWDTFPEHKITLTVEIYP